MAGIWRSAIGALTCFTMIASAAEGFGSGPSTGPAYYYYWGPPVYHACPPGPTVLPVPDARPTNEPPLQSSDARPKIITTRTLGGNEPSTQSKERCRVGFWNLTGHAVTLTVSGKSWPLAKDQAMTVELDRQFSWQVEGRAQHLERVPDEQMVYEVVVRE
jgi:hypothetical protein